MQRWPRHTVWPATKPVPQTLEDCFESCKRPDTTFAFGCVKGSNLHNACQTVAPAHANAMQLAADSKLIAEHNRHVQAVQQTLMHTIKRSMANAAGHW